MRFLETTSARETGGTFKVDAWNQSKSEVAASARAVAKRRDDMERIGLQPSAWVFGSKGLFQFLGPFVAIKGSSQWMRLRFPIEISGPDMAWKPGIAVAAAYDFARGLAHNVKNGPATWAHLRAGWGSLAQMHDADRRNAVAEKMEARAARLGWPKGWIHEPISVPPKRTPEQMAVLAEAAETAYWGCEIR